MTPAAAKKDRTDGGSLRIGTAGWSLPAAVRSEFPDGESLLARYGQGLSAVEINSSFYRPHQGKTYARWAAATPPGFRFSVKAPRAITHERRLVDIDAPLDRFVAEIAGLGEKLGCVLIQLPPSLAFDPPVAGAFFASWRARSGAPTAFEPRHASWFTKAADALLHRYEIARVAADPAVVPAASQPGGWRGLQYRRLHGSPKMYASAYDAGFIARLAAELPRDAWVIFDNTQFGAATDNALALQAILARRRAKLSPEPAHAR